jgi:tRNA uridine 5-carboxymethylaminomethyl modification enzyme
VSAPGFDVPDSPGDETLALAETEIKYHGYIERQLKEIERRSFLEEQVIPDGFNFDKVSGLSLEAVQKLSRFRPQTLGQASRIAGVSPADISLLSIKLKSFHHDLER